MSLPMDMMLLNKLDEEQPNPHKYVKQLPSNIDRFCYITLHNKQKN